MSLVEARRIFCSLAMATAVLLGWRLGSEVLYSLLDAVCPGPPGGDSDGPAPLLPGGHGHADLVSGMGRTDGHRVRGTGRPPRVPTVLIGTGRVGAVPPGRSGVRTMPASRPWASWPATRAGSGR